MGTERKVLAILNTAEQELLKEIAAAAQSGDLVAVDMARAIVGQIRRLSSEIDPKRKGSVGISKNGDAKVPRDIKERRIKDFPKFTARHETLYRLAWSRKKQSEYEHRVPKASVDMIVNSMAGLSRPDARPIEVDQIVANVNRSSVIQVPQYQVYLVVGWFATPAAFSRSEGMVIEFQRTSRESPTKNGRAYRQYKAETSIGGKQMSIERDPQIRFHEEGTLKSVTRWIRSHDEGLAEWLKNVRRAYQSDRANVADEDRAALLLFRDATDNSPARIGLLDVGGATLEDVDKWSTWQDPEASSRGSRVTEEETQGNGGKAYMYRKFSGPTQLLGVRTGGLTAKEWKENRDHWHVALQDSCQMHNTGAI